MLADTVSNTITSGNGETLAPTVTITADGSQVYTEQRTIPPGSSESGDVTIKDLAAGPSEICVEV